MKKRILATSVILTLGIASAPASAAIVYSDHGTDLLIVNNGDGSDFMESFSRWFGWMRF